MTATIAILGADGFVGRHLTRTLRDRVTVIRVCHREGGDADLWGDLSTAEPWGRLPPCDAIVNAAGLVGSRPGVDTGDYLDANTLLALRAAAHAHVSGAHLLQLSTAGVCGFRDEVITEATGPEPGDAYSLSKYLGEQACQRGYHDLRLTILRLSFPYGPGQRRGLVPTLAATVRKGAAVRLNTADGAPRVSPLFVEDLCAAVRRVLERQSLGLYNCGGSESYTIRQLSEEIAVALGLPCRFEVVDTPCADLRVDSTTLGSALSWTPAVALREGLRRTLEVSCGA